MRMVALSLVESVNNKNYHRRQSSLFNLCVWIEFIQCGLKAVRTETI